MTGKGEQEDRRERTEVSRRRGTEEWKNHKQAGKAPDGLSQFEIVGKLFSW